MWLTICLEVSLARAAKKELITVEFHDNYTHNSSLEFHNKACKSNIRICLNKCTGYILLESENKNHFL